MNGDVHLTGEEIAELHRQLDTLAPLAILPETRGFIAGARAALDVIAGRGED